jgi:hypothetical protein
MPKAGYKSLTVKQEIYDHFYCEWLRFNAENSNNKAVRSFSGYISSRLSMLIAEENRQKIGSVKFPWLNLAFMELVVS